jgi:hypothetical protein
MEDFPYTGAITSSEYCLPVKRVAVNPLDPLRPNKERIYALVNPVDRVSASCADVSQSS